MTRKNPIVQHPEGLLDVEEKVGPEISLETDAAEDRHYPPATFRKVAGAMVTVVVVVLATYTTPWLGFGQPWTPADPVPFWNLIGREFLGEGEAAAADREELVEAQEIARTVAHEDEAEGPLPDREGVERTGDGLPPYKPHPDDALEVKQSIEDPSGIALDSFYRALAETDAGFESAITRVSMWGDSVVGNDGITAAIRRRMQRRFGDAGHGFHLLQPPNASYKHQNVYFRHNQNWGKCFIIEKCRQDGHYGYGGVTFHSVAGAESRFGTARKGAFGRKVSRFELWYAGRPRGGKIQVSVDRESPEVIETLADQLEDRWHTIEVPDGPHRFKVRTVGGGKLRAYGAVMERDVPGVVWDGLSLIGAFTNRLAAQDPDHFESQIRHRNPDLVVLMFGGNDMIRTRMSMEQYKSEYREVIELMRGPNKDRACLIMAPVDHGQRKGQRIVTRKIVFQIVAAQRELAAERGCAFFDTFSAMGGEGSMGRWSRSMPRLGSGDLAHPTHDGHRVLGDLLYRALLEGYVSYRGKTGGG